MEKNDIISALGSFGIRSFYESETSQTLGRTNPRGDAPNCKCPFHGGAEDFSINLKTGYFNCFSSACGKKGSIFDFYMDRHGVDFIGAEKSLCEIAGLEWTGNGNGKGKGSSGSTEPTENLFALKWGAAKMNGLKGGAGYLKSRGISDQTIEAFSALAGYSKKAYAGKDKEKKVVESDSIVVPMWLAPGRDLVGLQNIFLPPLPVIFKKGKMEPIKKRHEYQSSPDIGVFFIGDPEAETYLITEAVIDGLSAYDVFPDHFVISLFSASNTNALQGKIPEGKKIVCCFDNHTSGQKAAARVAEMFPESLTVDWNLAKTSDDLNEILKSGESPLIASIVNNAISIKDNPDILDVITMQRGERLKAANAFMRLAARHGDIYKFGGALVRIDARGIFQPVDVETILFLMDLRADWQKATAAGPMPIDAPFQVAKAVFHGFGRPFNDLLGVVQNPIMLITGELIEKPGYDPKTKFFLDFAVSEWSDIPENPTTEEITEAFETLYLPFEDFPFESNADRSVFIAALLTAAVRPVLSVAPGFYISATTPSSGKSLLSKCLSIIAGGKAEVIPHNDGRDADEETRKRMLSIGMKSPRAIVIDNVIGHFTSAALCAWLTSETYEDRLLGSSSMRSVSTRSLFMVTGNNITPVGDLCRRLLRIHLDPHMERPWERRFPLDPLEHCRWNRLEMIRAAFIILRAGLMTGKKDKRQMGSFEDWSDFIRPAIFRLNDGIFDCVDPLDAIEAAFAEDPETTRAKALISAVEKFLIGDMTGDFTVSRLIAGSVHDEDLKDILTEIGGDRLNSRSIGRAISRVKGRIYTTDEGKRSIEQDGFSRSKVNRYFINSHDE